MNETMRNTLTAMAALVLAACSPQQPDLDSYDVLIVNGTVYDGSRNPPRTSNVGIRDGRIVAVDAPRDAAADEILDASGLAVVPGFIDPHTHALADLSSETGNANLNYLSQGVSTVFVGNDGGGLPDREQTVVTMQSRGIGSNVAFHAGHGLIRRTVMGLENRAPTIDELEQMRALVEEEMLAGAIGLSTGLFYTPGSYAETSEVIELAKVAARYNGIYDSHIRDEASYSIGLLGAVDEVLEIGAAAEIPVHFAHLKALGRDVWGQSGDIVARVEAARERGLQVTADQYPWRASGTRLGSSLVPRWVMADSREAMFERIDNPDLSGGIREEMDANLWRRGGSESLLITGESEWRGMTLEQVAESMETDALTAAIEVVRGGDPSIASFNMQPDDIHALAIQDWVMTGSDGSEGHPRKYASYPKGYRDFVVDFGLMTTERYVYRSSGLPADTFSLCDRGYIREGRNADIAILDLDEFRPIADFEKPTELSTGVVHMLVNGVPVIRDGDFTGALPGKVANFREMSCDD